MPHPRPPDRHRAPEGEAGGSASLPAWDLADLYPGPQCPRVTADLASVESAAIAFAERHSGRLAELSGAGLGAAIAEFERLEEMLGRLVSYAQLLFSSDSTNPLYGQFYQTINERATTISSHLIFFGLELNRIEEAVLAPKLVEPAAGRYRPWLRDLRVFRPHQLSEEQERLLHEKEVTGATAWSRLFDETLAGFRIPIGAETVTLSAALDRLSDRDRTVREAAGRAIGEVFGRNIRLFSLIINTIMKDKEIADRWRRYRRPASYRNLSNMVEDEVVEALSSAVVADYPRLAHRYYALKARWLGLEKLQHWDRNAPLPEDDDRKIGWAEAERRVLDAYAAFSPELAAIGSRFFASPWIDAVLRPGKAGGAFAHPTVPSVHPYILLNYHGRTRDVMTLAHELGHGVHQVLAGHQGYLIADTPLTLAETASVFGEMLTFRAMLDATRDQRTRRIMLAAKVEDMLNTVVRQIAFYRFETLLHDERRSGELLPERVGEIWLAVQQESLGPAFEFSEEYRNFWAYVPHFIHSPFYVYAYAFGDCLVNALYAVYREGHPGFPAKYLDMLRSGGAKRHRELLAPFGLDAADARFWKRGLDVIAGFVDELETMPPSATP
ncbi:MAG: M3 family oligoendopeptidase [Acetobacteraceae bacterium]